MEKVLHCYKFLYLHYIYRESANDMKLSDHLLDKTNANLIFNTVQLLALSVDCFIGFVGGIKNLMSECCRITKRKTKPSVNLVYFTCAVHFSDRRHIQTLIVF